MDDSLSCSDPPLVEHLSHGKWPAQQPAGLRSGFSTITGVAFVHRTVWLVGLAREEASGNQLTVVASNTGRNPLVEVNPG